MRRLWRLGLVVLLLLGAAPAGRLALLGDVQRVGGVAIGPDSFYTLTARGIQLWNAETGGLRETLKGAPNEDWKAFMLAPDGQSLAVAVVARDGPGATQIRLLPTGRKFMVEDLVEKLVFNREGGVLACAASGRGPVWVVEVGTGRARWKLGDEDGRVSSAAGLAFSPDSRLLAAGAAGGLYLWDLGTGALRLKFPGAAQGVAFSPDGSRLYAVQNGLTAFDVTAGAPLWNVKGEGSALALSPDGKLLAWAGRDLRLVDAATGQGKTATAPVLTKATATVSSVAVHFTPDGRRLVTGGDGGARVWTSGGRWLGGMAVWPGAELPWVSYAADGAYQAEPAALQYLRYEVGGRLRQLKDFPALDSPELLHKGWTP